MNMAQNAPRAGVKRKRVSKKTKKSWRKHADIKDVEAYLDDTRLQQRTGYVKVPCNTCER